MSAKIILIAASIAVISSICSSSPDPGPLQDFCVANFTNTGMIYTTHTSLDLS